MRTAFGVGSGGRGRSIRRATNIFTTRSIHQCQRSYLSPGAISFDSARSYGTPSYYVQKMFAGSRISSVFPSDLDASAHEVAGTGTIGLGTWNTQAQFKNVSVTADGQTLYSSDFTQNASNWGAHAGTWAAADGAYEQSSDGDDRTSVLSLPALKNAGDYTIHLKARKMGGAEGFLILFHVKDSDNLYWWNVGGWGNTLSTIEKTENGMKQDIGKTAPVQLVTGQWYDVRVELSGSRIRCYLDDALIEEVTDTETPLLAADAGRDSSGAYVIRVANGMETPAPVTIKIGGGAIVPSSGTAEVLTSTGLDDENSLDQPLKIAPVRSSFDAAAPTFTYIFKPRSLTILKIGGH